MPIADPSILLHEIRRMTVRSLQGRAGQVPDSSGASDPLLLERFLQRRDEVAFGMLVARHGPMVLGVCRSLLRHEQDAEDAFQATFLVLARKAGSIRSQESLGSWLHGVAYRLSCNLQARSRRRRVHERRAPLMPAADPTLDVTVRELNQAVMEEIGRLPDKYRKALVLCYLEGATQEAAAQQLGCSPGALRGRLHRGREELRRRLARRGLTLPHGALAVPLPGAVAAVRPGLVDATTRAALRYACGESVAAVSAKAAILAEEALKAIPTVKLSLLLTLVLGLSLLAAAFAVAPPMTPTPPVELDALEEHTALQPVGFDLWPVHVKPVAHEVWSVAFSPDGKTVASVSDRPGYPGELVLWDAATGKPRLRVRQHGARAVAFSPDGHTLAVGNHWDRTVRIFTASTGQVLRVLRGHDHGVKEVAFSPDGRTLATAGLDRTIRLWDIYDGRLKATLHGHTQDGVYSVAISRNGKWLASAGFDRTARVWELATGKMHRLLEGHTEPIEQVAFSPDGTLATASWDRTIKLWDPVTGAEKATLSGHTLPVLSLGFSPDGKQLASGSGKWGSADVPDQAGELKLWDVARRKERATLRGHTDRIWSVAFGRDGKTLASGGWDRTVRLWDVEARKERAALRFPERTGFLPRPVLAAAYAPGTDLLALAPEDGTVVLLDVPTGEVRHTLKGHADAVGSLAFSPDGRILASGGTDNTVRLWDSQNGKELRKLVGHTSWVHALAFSPDGKIVASAGWDRAIRLWDVASGKQRRLLAGHKATVRSLAFAPDGKTLASAGSDHTVKLWDLTTKEAPLTLKGHAGFVRAVAFSPDGKSLASSSEDGTVKLWDLAGGTERATLEPRKKGSQTPARVEMLSLAFAPRGEWLVVGGEDGLVRVWDPASGVSRGTLPGEGAVTGLGFATDGQRLIVARADGKAAEWAVDFARKQPARLSLPGTGEPGWAVAYSPDGRTLAGVSGGGSSGTLELWDVTTNRRRATLRDPKLLRCVAYSPDGKRLVTGCFDNTVQLRDPVSGQKRKVLEGHSRGVNSLVFRRDGKVLLSGSMDGTAKLWDVEAGKEVGTLAGHTSDVYSAAFSPDGRIAATASRDTTVKLWDAQRCQEIRTLEGHRHPVEQVAFSPDGKTVASASWDHTVRLWDAATGELRRVLRGQESAWLGLAFSADGQTLATCNGNLVDEVAGEMRLWDLATGQTSRVLQGHLRGVRDVRFSPDGRTLASMGEDGVIQLWDVRPQVPFAPR
jgi:RNA polymerase sigma factor (sigma-70 family)